MPHPPKELHFTGMIDEPSPFDTLEIWQDFQKTVETMPDKDSSKKYLLEMAKTVIAEKMDSDLRQDLKDSAALAMKAYAKSV